MLLVTTYIYPLVIAYDVFVRAILRVLRGGVLIPGFSGAILSKYASKTLDEIYLSSPELVFSLSGAEQKIVCFIRCPSTLFY